MNKFAITQTIESKFFSLLIFCILFSLSLGGCKSSEETKREIKPPEVTKEAPKETPPAEKKPEPPPKKDTVEVVVMPPAPKPDTTAVMVPPLPTMTVPRFSVQIGAFEKPENATSAQQRAKDRFTMPVFSNFDPTSNLYKVSVGSFATREEALEFRNSIVRKYPDDYFDAWVVELKK